MGVVSEMLPLGEISVAREGGVIKLRLRLHGPEPAGFQVCIHHLLLPLATVVGVIVQVPVPEAQLA